MSERAKFTAQCFSRDDDVKDVCTIKIARTQSLTNHVIFLKGAASRLIGQLALFSSRAHTNIIVGALYHNRFHKAGLFCNYHVWLKVLIVDDSQVIAYPLHSFHDPVIFSRFR